MALNNRDRLRQLLAEEIGDGEQDTDTLFSSEEIDDLLTRHHNDPDQCLVEGWAIKAAKLSNMVDVAEGDTKRALGSLMKAAISMAEFYDKLNGPDADQRPKIRRLFRPGFQG